MAAARVLEVAALVAGYAAEAPIVRGVSLAADRGEIVAILGPNGAGKSSLIKAIAGLMPLCTGRVALHGADISALPAHERVRHGMAFVPQTENVFASLTVTDNLKIAADLLVAARRRARRIATVCELFPDLARQRRLLAGRLSGGQRQMLAVARALIVEPSLLLLDEPSAGLSPKAVSELFRALVGIRGSGVGVVMVEQNVRAALDVADRLVVLVEGCTRLEGTAGALDADPAIAALYLGGTRARVPGP
jgi:branched-chain amino acid transport system ATP-binding protein